MSAARIGKLAYWGLVVAAVVAATLAKAAPDSIAPERALRALDQSILRYEALVQKIDDARVAATARAFLANFRQRRDALRKNYDATRHDELRFDINVESHRLAQWLAPLRTPPPARKAESS